MLKFIISESKLFSRLTQTPLLSHFFMLSAKSLTSVKDPKIFNEAIRKLRYGDVTGKETFNGRFIDLDNDALNFLKGGMSVHDVGCSTGVTSLELYETCEKNNLKLRYHISDKFTSLFFSGKFLTTVFDKDGKIRQIYFLNVLFDKHLSLAFFASKFLSIFFSRTIIMDVNKKNITKISLLDPKVQALEKEGKVTVLDYDVFEGTNEKYDFIRCMNVLNKSYFSDDQIKLGLENLFKSAKENGYLLIGRTNKHYVNRASLYKKNSNSFTLIKTYNGGSEVDDLLLMLSKKKLAGPS